jgi:hypothetical protein
MNESTVSCWSIQMMCVSMERSPRSHFYSKKGSMAEQALVLLSTAGAARLST